MSLCVSGAVGKRCSQVNSFTSSIEPRGSQTHTLKWKHHQLSRRQAPWTYSLKVFILDQKPWALSNIHHFSVQESDWVHGGVNFRGKKPKHTCMKQRTFEFLKVRLSTCILFDIKRLLIVKEFAYDRTRNNCTPVEQMEHFTEGSGIEKADALPESLVYNKVEAGKANSEPWLSTCWISARSHLDT